MDADRSILLQKTIRDNNEDLMNFMRDMKHWETDMKRKDAELSSQKVPDECIPPVRSKRRLKEKKLKEEDVEKSKQEKPKKKLSGFDYSAWDKFDVEKACEEVDKPSNNVSYESDSEVDSESEEEEDKLRQQAMYEKELGNKYVKKEKWKEAIEQYTKAIKCFDKDAIFYANRALCYLKTNQFKSAEEDCSKSLELDSQYVKAYLRRAAARMSLKKYKEAQSDLNSVLKLEPNNLQARKDLEKLNAERSNNIKVDNTATKEKSDVKATSPLNASSKEDNVTKLKSLPVKTSAFKNDINEDDYPWGVVDPKRVIKAVHKPPHMRSKKPLRRIEIVDVNDSVSKSQVNLNGASNVNDSSQKVIPNFNESKTIQGVVNVTNVINKEIVTNTVNPSRNIDKDIENINNITKENYKLILNNDEKISSTPHDNNTEIPPPPKTSVQFNLAWKKLKHDSNLLYLYLKKIDGRNFSSIFQDSLESDAFSGIVSTLCTEFIKHQTPVLSYLKGLTTIRRFEMLVLFMSKQDKEGLKQLIDYCISTNETTSDNAKILKKQFQLDN